MACAPLLFSAPPVVSPGIFLVTCCAINTLKSGELCNRALLLAKEMGITLQRVFIVPSGKGHLTNAFGMSSTIGLPDNLGKYLTKEQVHSKNRGYRLGRTSASRTLSRHSRGRRVGDPAAPGPSDYCRLEDKHPSASFGPPALLWQNRKPVEQTYG